MYRQTGPYLMEEQVLLQSGVLIRQLILPDQREPAMGVIDFVADGLPRGSVRCSAMNP